VSFSRSFSHLVHFIVSSNTLPNKLGIPFWHILYRTSREHCRTNVGYSFSFHKAYTSWFTSWTWCRTLFLLSRSRILTRRMVSHVFQWGTRWETRIWLVRWCQLSWFTSLRSINNLAFFADDWLNKGSTLKVNSLDNQIFSADSTFPFLVWQILGYQVCPASWT